VKASRGKWQSRGLLRIGGNGNLNVGALFEPHLIAISVNQGIFNTEISMPVIGPGYSNLCLLRLVRT
jgi:hypothetical protein